MMGICKFNRKKIMLIIGVTIAVIASVYIELQIKNCLSRMEKLTNSTINTLIKSDWNVKSLSTISTESYKKWLSSSASDALARSLAIFKSNHTFKYIGMNKLRDYNSETYGHRIIEFSSYIQLIDGKHLASFEFVYDNQGIDNAKLNNFYISDTKQEIEIKAFIKEMLNDLIAHHWNTKTWVKYEDPKLASLGNNSGIDSTITNIMHKPIRFTKFPDDSEIAVDVYNYRGEVSADVNFKGMLETVWFRLTKVDGHWKVSFINRSS